MSEARCEKCAGTGEIAVNAKKCLYVAPGPVPEDAKNLARSTCFQCLGTGFLGESEHDPTNPFAPRAALPQKDAANG